MLYSYRSIKNYTECLLRSLCRGSIFFTRQKVPPQFKVGVNNRTGTIRGTGHFSSSTLAPQFTFHSILLNTHPGLETCLQNEMETLGIENFKKLTGRSGALKIMPTHWKKATESMRSEMTHGGQRKDVISEQQSTFRIHGRHQLSLVELCQLLYCRSKFFTSVWAQVTDPFEWTSYEQLSQQLHEFQWNNNIFKISDESPIQTAAIQLWTTGDSRFRLKRELLHHLLKQPSSSLDTLSFFSKKDGIEDAQLSWLSHRQLTTVLFQGETVIETFLPSFQKQSCHTIVVDLNSKFCTLYVQLIKDGGTDCINRISQTQQPVVLTAKRPASIISDRCDPFWMTMLRPTQTKMPHTHQVGRSSNWSLAASLQEDSLTTRDPTVVTGRSQKSHKAENETMSTGIINSDTNSVNRTQESHFTNSETYFHLTENKVKHKQDQMPSQIAYWVVQMSSLIEDLDALKKTSIWKQESRKPIEAMERDPLVIWDPFCGDGTLLRSSLSSIYNYPATLLSEAAIRTLPLLEILTTCTNWSRSLSSLNNSMITNKETLLNHISLIGSDSRIDSLREGNKLWSDYAAQNFTTQSQATSQSKNQSREFDRQRLLGGVNWEDLLDRHTPLLLCQSIAQMFGKSLIFPSTLRRAPLSSKFAKFKSHSNSYSYKDWNDQPTSQSASIQHLHEAWNVSFLEDLIFPTTPIKIGTFHCLSPEMISTCIERPYIITSFPGDALLLKSDSNSRKAFQNNIQLFDRLIVNGGPWRQVIVLAQTKRFLTKSQLRWIEVGQCRSNQAKSYYLYEWKGEFKSSWRNMTATILNEFDVDDFT